MESFADISGMRIFVSMVFSVELNNFFNTFSCVSGRRNQLENETMEELLKILRKEPVEISPTISCPQAKSDHRQYCNEVYPNLFISGL